MASTPGTDRISSRFSIASAVSIIGIVATWASAQARLSSWRMPAITGPSCVSRQARSASSTTASACSRVLTIGTTTPWAPASSTLPMMPARSTAHDRRAAAQLDRLDHRCRLGVVVDAVLEVDADVVDRHGAVISADTKLGSDSQRPSVSPPAAHFSRRLVMPASLPDDSSHDRGRGFALRERQRCRSSARRAGAGRPRWRRRCAA